MSKEDLEEISDELEIGIVDDTEKDINDTIAMRNENPIEMSMVTIISVVAGHILIIVLGLLCLSKYQKARDARFKG